MTTLNVIGNSNVLSTKSKIVSFMEFLKQEVANKEWFKLVKSSFVELYSKDKPKNVQETGR